MATDLMAAQYLILQASFDNGWQVPIDLKEITVWTGKWVLQVVMQRRQTSKLPFTYLNLKASSYNEANWIGFCTWYCKDDVPPPSHVEIQRRLTSWLPSIWSCRLPRRGPPASSSRSCRSRWSPVLLSLHTMLKKGLWWMILILDSAYRYWFNAYR